MPSADDAASEAAGERAAGVPAGSSRRVLVGLTVVGAGLLVSAAFVAAPRGSAEPLPASSPSSVAVPESASRTPPNPETVEHDDGTDSSEGTTSEEQVTVPSGPPREIRISRVGIGVVLDPLGLDLNGELEVPEDYARGGWYVDGPRPGETGPAVVAAHVDSTDGPAPFYRLSEVVVGDRIEVVYPNGDEVAFVATRIEQHAKDQFPTLEVYGNTDEPELRLITCGGDFDRRARSYRHNVIVWAVRSEAAGELT